jgi:hypothetical protein
VSGGTRPCGPIAALLAFSLAGCSSVGGVVGAIAGVATGTFSSNPAVGVAVGISVKAATDIAMNRVSRDMQSDEQGRIADIAGDLKVGDRQAWQIHHVFALADQAGELQVLSSTDNALATCKEVMFSVIGGKRDAPTREWFITQTCLQADGHWHWAAAEPATERWGDLQ